MFCSSQSYWVFRKIFVLGKGTGFRLDIISSFSYKNTFLCSWKRNRIFIKLTFHGFQKFVFFD